MYFLPPANEVWGKVIFLHQFVILFTGGGVRGCSRGGVHGCSRGAVWLLWRGHAFFPRGGAWLFLGGHAWLLRGACMVFSGGHAWFFLAGEAFMVFSGGCMVFSSGGACVVFSGGVCVVWRGVCIGYDEIRSMSGRYASYWNAFFFMTNFSGPWIHYRFSTDEGRTTMMRFYSRQITPVKPSVQLHVNAEPSCSQCPLPKYSQSAQACMENGTAMHILKLK